MTDKQALELLTDFDFLQYSRCYLMLDAMEHYEQGDMQQSWYCLLIWCEAADGLENAWKKVNHCYERATYAKNGWRWK